MPVTDREETTVTEPDDLPDLEEPERIEPADVLAARCTSGPTAVPVGPQRCIALLRGITSADAVERIGAAEGPGDLRQRGSLDAREGRTLAWVLAWAAVVESGWYPQPVAGFWPTVAATLKQGRLPVAATDRLPVRRGFLYSLHELAADGWAPAAALRQVTSAIAPADLSATESGRYERLAAARSWPVREPPPEELPNLPDAEPGRPVGPQAALDMVRGVVNRDATERRVWAQAVSWAVADGRLDGDEASTLAVILAWAIQIETADVRAASLAALDAIARRDQVPPWALDQVLTHLPDPQLDETERSLLASLTTALAEHRRRVPDPPMDRSS